MKYAVIDVGSNTIRLIVYAVEEKEIAPLFSKKFTTGLVGYVHNGRMSQEGIHKACHVLSECRRLLQQFTLQKTFVFATASLRNIQNTQEAVEQIALLTGYSIDVISGQTEAYLDYYGVLHDVSLESGLLFDIGGGSTELVTFAHDGPGIIESLPLGSLTLSCSHVEKVFPKQKEREAIREQIKKELKKKKLHCMPSYTTLCGVGGTARTLLQLAQVQQKLPEGQRTLTTQQFDTLTKFLWKKDAEVRTLLLQNCPDRLHTIFPGLLVVEALVQLTKCDEIYISSVGVREGYLRRALAKRQKEEAAS